MAEPVGILTRKLGPVGPDEVASYERREPRRHFHVLRDERLDGAAVEELSFDRASLEHRPLRFVELVEPRCQQSAQRRRHLDIAVALSAERDHLGQEERISARGANDPFADVVRNGIADESPGLLFRQRIQAAESPSRWNGGRAAPAAPGRGAGAVRRSRATPSIRRGRGRSPHPTGCHRSRPRAAPALRTVSGAPTRSHRCPIRRRSPRAATGSPWRPPRRPAACRAASPPLSPAST